MSKKLTKLYNIKYHNNSPGPEELVIDLDQFEWSNSVPVGPMNLNFKVYRAIREITGYDASTCQFDTIYVD